MATNVLLIDEDAFVEKMEDRRKYYAEMANAAKDKNNFEAAYYAAVAMSIIEVSRGILSCSKIEKWD